MHRRSSCAPPRFLLLLACLVPAAANAAAPANANNETRLLRFPTIHGKHIVFTYAGDLYTVSAPAASPGG